MTWGLAGAVAAAVLYGVTIVLQVVAVRRQPQAHGLDVRLLAGLARTPIYVLSTALEFFAFLLSLAALRSLPLFVVQAVLCGNFAVTALISWAVLRVRLAAFEWVAVVVVTGGIAMLALSARQQQATGLSTPGRFGLVAAAGVLVLAAVAAARTTTRYGPALLGLVAGLSFGTVDVSARVLRDPSSASALLTDPATLSLAGAGILGLWVNATALQRARVTVVVAADVVAYSVVPAVVGVLLLGDAPRPGWAPVAAAGFVLAVGGAIALARLGTPQGVAEGTRTEPVMPAEPAPEPSPGPRRARAADPSGR